MKSFIPRFSRIISFGTGIFIATTTFADRPIGIDVSDYQSASINWATLKNTYGISFAWAKATEGTGTAGGSHFTIYAANAKAAGVLIGAYHFARYDLNKGTNGAMQEATNFFNVTKNYLKGGGYYLMPMLDCENINSSSGPSQAGYTKTTFSQWANAWCNTLSNLAYAAGANVKPCIYTSSSFASTWFDSTVTKWNLDVAEWKWYNNSSYTDAQRAAMAQTAAPSTSPWPTWQFWQYDDRNVAQAHTTGDGDIFNGTMEQLRATMVITPVGPTISSQPASKTVDEGASVTFSVIAKGAGTLQYQWRLNQTNISGATQSSYTISNVQAVQGGIYSVAVTDNNGTSVSDDAVLSVLVPLVNAPGSILAPTGMVNWWPADGSAIDIFGIADGVPKGGFYYAPGKMGTAFHFDGSTGIITTGAGTIPVPWTISLWVNRENTPQTSALLIGDGNVGLKLEQYNATHQVGLTILGVGDYIFSPAYTVPAGTWTHLTFVGTSTGTTLYVNGVLKASLTNSVALPRNYIGAAYITSSAKYVDFLKGSLDEIVTFNRALSPSEISAIYAAGSAGFVRGPQILKSRITGPTQVTFDLEGQTGKNYTIYSSTNLIDWANIGTLANPLGTNSFIDNNAGANAQKFYRISQTY